MAEQPLGSINVGADDDTIQLLNDIVQSSMEIADHMSKAGQSNEKLLDYMKSTSTEQRDMLMNMVMYREITSQIITNAQQVSRLTKDSLDTQKEITKELQSQTNEQDKQKKDLPTKSTDSSAKALSNVQRAVKDPVGALFGQLEKIIPPGIGKLALGIGGVLAKEAAKTVSMMRSITRTGGMGMDEGVGGSSNASQIRKSMLWASLPIPFIKEAQGTEEELTRGAGTMFGLGGIRGEELVKVFKWLPEAAYDAGVGFENASKMLSNMSRTTHRTSDEMENIFGAIANSARTAGASTNEWFSIIDSTVKKSAHLGGSYEEMNLILKDLYPAIRHNRISAEDLTAEYVKLKSQSATYAQIQEHLTSVIGDAIYNIRGSVSIRKTRDAIEESILETSKGGYEEAREFASKGLRDFALKVDEGTRDLGALKSAMKPLREQFNQSSESAAGWVDTVEESARRWGGSGPEAVKAMMDISKSYLAVSKDAEKSLAAGAEVTAKFTKAVADGATTWPEVTGLMKEYAENFNMLPGETSALVDHFIRLGKAVGEPTSKVAQWHQAMSTGIRDMFDDPKKASDEAAKSLNMIGGMIAKGQIDPGEYAKIMRTQMDVMQTTGSEASVQFETLAKIVSNTNVRFSELASQSEQLSKINRQYGYDQQASNALLVSFNEHLRTGSVSLQDLGTIMKGPGGASEGMRGLMLSQLKTAGGVLGKIFSSAGTLGGVDVLIPQFMEWAGNKDAKPSEALLQAAGGSMAGISKSEALSSMGQLMSSNVQGMIQQGGGSLADQLAMFKRMSGSIFDSNIQSWGSGLQFILDSFLQGGGGGINIKDVLPDAAKAGDNMKVSVNKFDTSVKNWNKGLGDNLKIAQQMAADALEASRNFRKLQMVETSALRTMNQLEKVASKLNGVNTIHVPDNVRNMNF